MIGKLLTTWGLGAANWWVLAVALGVAAAVGGTGGFIAAKTIWAAKVSDCNAKAETARADTEHQEALRWKASYDLLAAQKQREDAAKASVIGDLTASNAAAQSDRDALKSQLAKEKADHAKNPAYAVCFVPGTTRVMLDKTAGVPTGTVGDTASAAPSGADAKAGSAQAAPPLTLDQCTEGYNELAQHDRGQSALVAAWQAWAGKVLIQPATNSAATN